MNHTMRVQGRAMVDPAYTGAGGVPQSARILVEAGSAVHHQTMAAKARRIVREMNADGAPDYVNSVTGERRPGQWSEWIVQVGPVGRNAYGMLTKAADYSAIVVPA